MRRMILYLLGIGLMVYLAALYESSLLVAVLALQILAPIPSCILGWRAAKGLNARLSVPIPAADKGEEILVELQLQNSSRLSILHAEVKLAYWNQFRNRKTIKKYTLRVNAKGRSTYQFKIASERCGNIKICVERLRVWDYLGLLGFSAAGGQQETVSVLPSFFEFPVDGGEELPGLAGETDEFDTRRGGDDPSEIFQIRSYRPGDRPQNIHWKMTARSEELMVKEFSLPIRYQTAVFLDLHGEAGDGKCWDGADAYLETALSLSFGLLEAERRHYVIWYERDAGELCRKRVEKPEDIHELTGMLFRAMPYTEEFDLEDFCRRKYPGETFSVSYRLDLKCRLWKGGVLEWEKTAP